MASDSIAAGVGGIVLCVRKARRREESRAEAIRVASIVLRRGGLFIEMVMRGDISIWRRDGAVARGDSADAGRYATSRGGGICRRPMRLGGGSG